MLQAAVRERAESERARREELNVHLAQADAETGAKRAALDNARDTKAKLEVSSTESTRFSSLFPIQEG